MVQDNSARQNEVAIIGAGVIGLSIAWRLAQRGLPVTVFDKGEAGQGASHAAAGMLAACAEIEPSEERLLTLNRASQALWPAFAAELEAASGLPVELRTEGTLMVALTADDAAKLRNHAELQGRLGLPVSWLSGRDLRRLEPALAPGVAGGVSSPEDHQVDNRKLAQALRVAALRAGVTLVENTPIEGLSLKDGRVAGVITAAGLREAGRVVLAAGPWSRGIPGLPAEARPAVRPVKGQMLALAMDPAAPLLRHVVWAPGVYLVPRLDGRLIVGATVEEKGFDTAITAGGLLSLLHAAWRALPGIEELPVLETWVGHRPGSRDDAPIFGAGPVEGLVYATGHHRNGILLTPITAKLISDFILSGKMDSMAEPFGFGRFMRAAAA
ncbi:MULTISPECIES: glycine oxidase ThiO [unclassified Chelatococcus]|uniref:glycine oxidase ThiO n=1 Tax=unclassified Chelatococcus TaxID=2638111 RepID=UPI001BD03B50|nr:MULTISPECIES: glycine oxidase ThiO [unclassified Chelatococcus]CAH1672786.1 Glycine oxidase [Hyphomicrobiales bacterium]MBS7738634.1 glycine oxidase ThiO [Chelatococcus sp. HY11]MBX3543038.1 glycine oxidase ThiO [Chelatococcus sp.]MCO5076836.1 glycine oxidase ThiO [Chelatococcus sp.]CAH1674970.1 Glycine oxidase [Hyphomicrobiales bacterium]